MSEPFEHSPTPQQSKPWLRWLGFSVLNCWLVFHLAAIFISPLSVEPSAPIAQDMWRITGPYAQAIYMNHGYHFFAPNPGGSTLLGYELEFEDGTTQQGMLPDKKIWPRLLYHRHFMLTGHLDSLEFFDEEFRHALLTSYAEALCTEHQAEKVTLIRVQHDVPSLERFLAGGRLTDQDLYAEETLGTYSCDDF